MPHISFPCCLNTPASPFALVKITLMIQRISSLFFFFLNSSITLSLSLFLCLYLSLFRLSFIQNSLTLFIFTPNNLLRTFKQSPYTPCREKVCNVVVVCRCLDTPTPTPASLSYIPSLPFPQSNPTQPPSQVLLFQIIYKRTLLQKAV